MNKKKKKIVVIALTIMFAHYSLGKLIEFQRK